MSEYKLVKNYIETFKKYSVLNLIPAEFSYHFILGQLIKNNFKIWNDATWLDSRVSFLWVKKTGTGKSSAWEFIANVGEKAGLRTESLADFNDASLIPTIEVKTEKGGEKSYRVTTDFPLDCDLFHMDEASALFSPTMNQDKAINFLQQALNPIGSKINIIKKKLTHGDPIVVAPKCSLWFTTMPPQKFIYKVIGKGAIQRLIFYPQRTTLNDRKEISKIRREGFFRKTKTKAALSDIVTEFKRIRDYSNDVGTPTISNNGRAYLNRSLDSFYNYLGNVNNITEDIMGGFAPRMENYTLILSGHNALIDNKDRIEASHVKNAIKLTKEIFTTTTTWIEKETVNIGVYQDIQLKQNENDMIMSHKRFKEKWVLMRELVDHFMKRYKYSSTTAYALLENTKIWEKKKIGGNFCVRCKK